MSKPRIPEQDAERGDYPAPEQVRSGASFSESLSAHPRTFPIFVVNLVRAGEASGALDQILFRLAEFLEKQLALRTKVTNAIVQHWQRQNGRKKGRPLNGSQNGHFTTLDDAARVDVG